ncbi:hypothetical protein [Floricoccus penangensis]|uniref:hypothetical protein n=1 Tax=Floricoccus penangensis TaxID=1859475 RepID=UPI00203E5113|nr:hypothetical protein [Floricoccus penangensis]URZ87819.1 hypothetical protein KIW23_01855 [Floricoccus penangensis]
MLNNIKKCISIFLMILVLIGMPTSLYKSIISFDTKNITLNLLLGAGIISLSYWLWNSSTDKYSKKALTPMNMILRIISIIFLIFAIIATTENLVGEIKSFDVLGIVICLSMIGLFLFVSYIFWISSKKD